MKASEKSVFIKLILYNQLDASKYWNCTGTYPAIYELLTIEIHFNT